MPHNRKALSLTQKAAYASANYGKSLWWTSTEYFLLYFLTDQLGIEPLAAGVIMLISLAWDGITDPIMGFLIERMKNKVRGFAIYLLIGSPFTATFFILMFYKPTIWENHWGLYALIVGLLFRTFYSVIDVPHNAMLASLTRDSRERTGLASLRIFFSSLGGVTVSLGIYEVFLLAKGDSHSDNFLILAIVISVISITTLAICSLSTRKLELERKLETSDRIISFTELVNTLRINRQLWVVFSLTALTSIATPVFAKTVIYYAKYGLLHEEWAGLGLLAMTLGQAVFLPFWTSLSHKSGKSESLKLAHLAVIVILTLFVFTPISNQFIFYVFCFISGTAIGGIYMLNWAIVPDVVEYGESQSGLRIEAGIFGLFTFTNKVSLGVGTAVLGLTLSSIGYESNSIGNELLIDNFKWIMSAIPIIGSLLCLVILPAYKITHKFHSYIQEGK